MKRGLLALLMILLALPNLFSNEWKIQSSKRYYRITDSIVRDLDGDGIDEVVIASYSFSGKVVDIYKIADGVLTAMDSFKVPKATIFFDVGDLDNDGRADIVFLASDGLYYNRIAFDSTSKLQNEFRFVETIKSQLVVPQPELLTDVPMVIDLDGNGKNELVIENISEIQIFETAKFKKLAAIDLKTILEFSLIPGQFYPHYIFYTLPIILITDIDNDNKKEIITKFPRSMNIYSQQGLDNWLLAKRITVNKDNVYFLADSFVKFSFPIIEDLDNDNVKELVISTANLDMPKIRFEAVGDIYYFKPGSMNNHRNNKIVLKGIPVNLPYFYNITDEKYKDLLCPVMPFNLITIFGIISGTGNIKVPFMLYRQENNSYDTVKPRKLFEIPFRIESIMSFVEEVPFDQHTPQIYPDFYYFEHKFKDKKVELQYYSHDQKRDKYYTEVITSLDIPTYTPELPANLKLGHFSNNNKKDILFIIHSNFFIVNRDGGK